MRERERKKEIERNHCAGKRKGGPIHPPKKISPRNDPLAHSVYIVISYFQPILAIFDTP